MLNLIKMNISRLFRTKALYTTMIIEFVLFFLITMVGGEGSVVEMAGEFLGSGLVLMLVGIFATVYSDEERKSGFLKNLGSSNGRKRLIFVSKIPVIFLYNVILLIAGTAATFIGMMGRGAAIGNLASFAVYLLFEALIGTAFGTAFLAIYEVARGNVMPIILTIIAAGNLHGMLLSFVEAKIAQTIPALAPAMGAQILSGNLIVSRAQQISVVNPFDHFAVLVVAIVGIAVYAVLGMTVFEKRDTF